MNGNRHTATWHIQCLTTERCQKLFYQLSFAILVYGIEHTHDFIHIQYYSSLIVVMRTNQGFWCEIGYNGSAQYWFGWKCSTILFLTSLSFQSLIIEFHFILKLTDSFSIMLADWAKGKVKRWCLAHAGSSNQYHIHGSIAYPTATNTNVHSVADSRWSGNQQWGKCIFYGVVFLTSQCENHILQLYRKCIQRNLVLIDTFKLHS